MGKGYTRHGRHMDDRLLLHAGVCSLREKPCSNAPRSMPNAHDHQPNEAAFLKSAEPS